MTANKVLFVTALTVAAVIIALLIFVLCGLLPAHPVINTQLPTL